MFTSMKKSHLALAVLLLNHFNLLLAAPQDVARKLLPSTVLIATEDSGGRPLAIGSGFVIDDGYIASNYHVIEGAASGHVKLAGEQKTFKIIGVVACDKSVDLAILKVDAMSLSALPLSLRDDVQIGEAVYAAGNPRGLENTFSQGIVSAFRDLGSFKLLQITAPISPGSSGGPIADEKGEVIGIAVATYRGGQNLNFAIPVSALKILQKAVSEPKRLSTLVTKKGKDLFSSLESKRSTQGVSLSNFAWEGGIDGSLDSNGSFSLSIQNNLGVSVKGVTAVVIFYNAGVQVVDVGVIQYPGVIPPKLARRTNGNVDPAVKKFTTPISRRNQFMYADKPSTPLGLRVISFEIVDQ